MRSNSTIQWIFLLTVVVFLAVFSLPPASASSLDKEGKREWSIDWSPPNNSDIVTNFTAAERKYVFHGTGQVVHNDKTEAMPAVYFDYEVTARYEINTGMATENITVSGQNPPVNPPLHFTGQYKSAKDPWLVTTPGCRVLSRSGTLDTYTWYQFPPISSNALSPAQMAMLKEKAIAQAKILDIVEPRENQNYSAKNDMLFMVKQLRPEDLSIPQTNSIMIQIQETGNPSNRMSKILQTTGGASVWTKTLPMQPGNWQVRAYIYAPVAESPANAPWRKFIVTDTQALGQPPQEPPLVIVSPTENQVMLFPGNVNISLKVAQNLLKNNSLAVITVYRIPPSQPGAWPETPVKIFSNEYPVHSADVVLNIPSNTFTSHGKHQLFCMFYPEGKLKPGFEEKRMFSLEGLSAPDIKKMKMQKPIRITPK